MLQPCDREIGDAYTGFHHPVAVISHYFHQLPGAGFREIKLLHVLDEGLFARWDDGDCPWGPYRGTIPVYACTRACTETFGEANITCDCLPTGVGACCIDTGGLPTCYGYGDGGPP